MKKMILLPIVFTMILALFVPHALEAQESVIYQPSFIKLSHPMKRDFQKIVGSSHGLSLWKENHVGKDGGFQGRQPKCLGKGNQDCTIPHAGRRDDRLYRREQTQRGPVHWLGSKRGDSA